MHTCSYVWYQFPDHNVYWRYHLFTNPFQQQLYLVTMQFHEYSITFGSLVAGIGRISGYSLAIARSITAWASKIPEGIFHTINVTYLQQQCCQMQ